MIDIIKDLLKPPFFSDNKDIVNCEERLIAEINYDTEFYVIAKWIAAAMNEKWERDFGEPLRWKVICDPFTEFVCPKCGDVKPTPYSYCSHCGQRLEKPE